MANANTVYDKDFHPKRAKEILKAGKSKNSACAEFDICKQTFYEWEKIYPEFRAEVQKGLAASEALWEQEGQSSLESEKYNTGMYMIQMRNRFGWSARDAVNVHVNQAADAHKESLETLLDQEDKLAEYRKEQ